MKKSMLAACAAIVLVSLLACGGTPPPVQQTAALPEPEAPAPALAAQAAPAPAPAPAPARPAPPPAPASPYFTGDGGRGRRLAVVLPDAVGLAPQYNYLPDLVQGVLVRDFARFSAITVLDRMRMEAVMMELENAGITQTSEDFFRQRAAAADVDYFLMGNITRTATGHAVQFQVVGGREPNLGVARAAFSESLTVAQMDDHTGIHRASAELLAGMGISLTDRARTELSRAETRQTINAQVALAQGINAQRAGTVVEALSRYIQATQHDPTLGEAVSRLNVLTASVQSGNIREDVRNEIRWRDEWVATIAETNAFYQRYVSQRPPLNLVYTTNITQGDINFQARTVELTGVTVALYPELAWFEQINTVLGTVAQGLQATERAERWGINWIRDNAGLFLPNYNAIWATVEIVNADGRVLGSRQAALPYGWNTVSYGTWARFTRVRLRPIAVAPVTLTFPGVNPDHVTDRLTVRIASINGIPAAQASAQKNISIMTSGEFYRRPDSDFVGRWNRTARSQRAALPFELLHAEAAFYATRRINDPWSSLHRNRYESGHRVHRFGRIVIHGDIGNRELRSLSFRRYSPTTYIISPTVTTLYMSGNRDVQRLILPPSVRTVRPIFSACLFDGIQHIVIGGNVNLQRNPIYPHSRYAFTGHNSDIRLRTVYNNTGRRSGIYFTVRNERGILTWGWAFTPHQLMTAGAAPAPAAAAVPAAAAPAPAPAQATAAASGFLYVTADALNVRSGPSANHALVGQVTRGTRVQVLGANGNWRRIRAGNTEGYASLSFLAATAPAARAAAPAAPPPAAAPQQQQQRGLLDRAADFLFGR